MAARWLAAALVLFLARTGPLPGQDLEPVPAPDLTGIEEAVRDRLEAQAAAVEELARPDTEPARLGAAYGALGRLYHAYDFPTAAAACYRNARRLASGDFRWAYYLGFLHQTEGDLERAAERLTEALALRPDDPAALLRLGDVELELERYAAARGRYERALELDADAAAAHYGLGRLAARSDDPAAAVRHFERALELQPGASLVHYPLALAYRELGRREQAERHLGLRGQVGVGFPDPLVRALDEDLAGVGLRLTRAGVALAEGREEAALVELRKAVAAAPGSFDARLGLGLALARAGEREGAREQLEEAVRLAPESVLARDALGRLLAGAGADEGAVAHFSKAVALDPSFAEGHFQLGAALGRLGRHAEAAEAFSRVLEIEPGHADALLARATERLDLGELAAARRDLEALLGRDPQHARARLRLGEALQRLGEGGALDAYLRALDIGLEPADGAAAHLSAGNLLAQRREGEAALEHYRAALELDPGLAGARYNLAGVLSGLGRHAEAAEAYRAVLEREPENASARLYLAQSLAALGRHREAREQLERGLKAAPRDGRLAHALARTLAASPDRAVRDGRRAVELALGVLAAQKSLAHAETVAMAFAEMGRFDEAVRWQNQVIAAAESDESDESDPSDFLARLRRNLARYESGEACCAGD